MRQTWRWVAIAVVLSASAGVAWGYLVAGAVSLEKLAEEADVVFKGTAVGSGPVQDEWFKPYPDFVARQTRFQVVSVLKGEAPAGELAFRHYEEDPNPRGRMFEPQHYRFEAGRTYIVFAKKGEEAGVFRQIWMYHKSKLDQGVLLCADKKPAAGKTVKEVIWSELLAMLRSVGESDVTYAIDQLDQMSAGEAVWGGLSDFDRKEVLAAVREKMIDPHPAIARAAIVAVGSHNPYMSRERALFWLATVGGGEAPGIGKMNPNLTNPGGETYWQDLAALADGKAAAETRALAITALGLVREPALQDRIGLWLQDPSPDVRAAAALLLADFPGPETLNRLTDMEGDPAPQVRTATAHAVGFGQYADLADILARLLTDKERPVREGAAMSLLSFSPKKEAMARVFRANLANEEFHPLFLIALARQDPEHYVDALAEVVEKKPEPKNFWGGQIPAFTAWEILFKYLQARPAEEVRSGKLDRYLDAMEQVGNYSSSEPRDIYAFYVQRGMTERARKFREAATGAATYDLDRYFRQVDENPSLYLRD